MDRLTDRKTAAALKKNADGLKSKGIEPSVSDLRYIKLAEYENAAELIETAAFELDEEPKHETKWAKNNPSINLDGKNINNMIMRRFMERW